MAEGHVAGEIASRNSAVSRRMHEPAAKPIEIFVDADACSVKEGVYRVARRYQLRVYVVSNGGVRVPADPLLEMVVVEHLRSTGDITGGPKPFAAGKGVGWRRLADRWGNTQAVR